MDNIGHYNPPQRCDCHSCTQSRRSQIERAMERFEPSAKLEAAEALAKAAEVLVGSFSRMRDDHHEKLVHHQTLESASGNWDKLLQEPLEFGPLIQALEIYKAQ